MLNRGGRVRFAKVQTRANFSRTDGLIFIPFSVNGCQHQWLYSVKISSESNNICDFYKHFKLGKKKLRAKSWRPRSVAVGQVSITQVIKAWFSFRLLYMVADINDYHLWKFYRNRNICGFYKHVKLVEKKIRAKGGGRVRFGSCQTSVNFSINNGLILIPFSVYGCQHQWLSSVKISSESNNICEFYKHFKLVESIMSAKLRRPCSV